MFICSCAHCIIILLVQTHHTHCINNYPVHRIGYVIISKPNCPGRESRNSRCGYFVAFCRFCICSRFDRSCCRSACRRSTGRWRPTVTQLRPLFDRSLAMKRERSLVQSNEQSRRRLGFREFFAYKILLGRSEMRTRDRKCFQSIRTV